jgi:hypothetical protein
MLKSSLFVALTFVLLVASPASTLAQPAPPVPIPGGRPAAPTGPTLDLADLPPGFVPSPPFLERYSSDWCSSCVTAEYVRGDEYVASSVQEGSDASDTWEAFPGSLVPHPAYTPRWLDPPSVGEEAALFGLTDWVSSGPISGYELKWRRGSHLARVTVLGVADDPDFAVELAQGLDAQIAALSPGRFVPPPKDQVGQIDRQVRELRGLPPRGRPDFTMVAPSTTGGFLWKLNLTSWPPDVTGARMLDNPDQRSLYADLELDLGILRLLGQQVDLARLQAPGPSLGGVYSTRNQVGIVAGSWPLGWREQIVTAHEFVHSAQDQHFGLDGLIEQFLLTSTNRNTDGVLALLALLDGEAELTARLWAETYLEPGAWEALKAEEEQRDRELGVPALWRSEVRFPYWQGERFSSGFYEDGGWAEVNALFGRPPISSEQVLHPDLYVTNERPIRVETPTTAGVAVRGWLPLVEDTFGEIGVRAVLEPFLDPERAAAAAAGWGGDRYVIVGIPTVALFGVSGYAEALVLESVWDSPAEAQEFFDALAESLDTRFLGEAQRQPDGFERFSWGNPEFQVMAERRGNRVRFVVAPDPAAIAALAPRS